MEVVVIVVLGIVAWPTRRTDDIDSDVAASLFARPGTWERSAAATVTFFGSPAVVTVATVLVAVWAWRRFRSVVLALFCPLSVAIAGAIEHLVKLLVARPRPATAVLAHQLDFSYPSGHATAASALALSLALLVWAGGQRRHRGLLLAALSLYGVAVAASRVVLGVHYLSDVIGAAGLGTASVLTVGWFCSRQRTKPPADPSDSKMSCV
ncbi:MAG: phosphatase PAP2 family protein [Acidimicrobiales bacterium]